jgi:hypothetical protein
MTTEPTPRYPGDGPRFGIVHVLATVTALLGVAMIVTALAGGGGAGSYGVLVGALFLAAGVMRLRLLSVRARTRR